MAELIPIITDILLSAGAMALRMGPYLVLGLIIAAALGNFGPSEKLHRLMTTHGLLAIAVASIAAVTTPLCSCTTVSIMIPLLAAGVPWGPIFSWLIASPIISPTGFILIGGTLGWPLAFAKVLTGLTMGIGGGILANRLQKTGFLAHQSRVPVAAGISEANSPAMSDPTSQEEAGAIASACCETAENLAHSSSGTPGDSIRSFGNALYGTAKSIVPIFILFLVVAAAIEQLVPTAWISSLFGEGRIWGVPIAALLGVPLYTNTASAVPLVSSFMGLGMTSGAALAFILTGPGTSLPAMGAVLVIARWRLLAYYLAVLFTVSILFAFAFDLLLAS